MSGNFVGRGLAVAFLAVCAFDFSAWSQLRTPPAPVLTQSIDESNLFTLGGNTRPEARRENDRGRVSDDFALDHLTLQLRRTPERELALKQYLDQLTDPRSVNFHKWLTADQLETYFSPAPADRVRVTEWLENHGFTVNGISAGMIIDFSGTAGLVRQTFHTEIHHLMVNGVAHFGNVGDPRVPAALASLLGGVVSFHNFAPRPLLEPALTPTVSSGFRLVGAADLEKIYSFPPLYTAGYSGQGQTIVVIEDSNVYSPGDWAVFRKAFGLALKYPKGTFTQIHPSAGAGGACVDPGANADDSEAIIDAEWATAAAPSAAIVLASCADTTNFGGFIALQNLLTNGGPLPTIVSISYGEGESAMGAAMNLYVNNLYQMAAAMGVSIFVSAGDSGAAANDHNVTAATHGINVSGFASTPYNVAVGGTDFGDVAANAVSAYWNPTNGLNFVSALSYIPEIPWNNSCAGILWATFNGNPTPEGLLGFCNTSAGQQYLTTVAGSGGPSGCATGSAATASVVSGTCAGYSKPAWQAGFAGIQNDGVRDLPDVSMFAANGIWQHYYVVCYSDPTAGRGGASCLGPPGTWSGFGGTSVSAPIMAGIQALINQRTGSPQGLPNPTLYSLAAAEYGASGNILCNSSLGSGTASGCIFYDVTQGDIAVNCVAPAGEARNCDLDHATNGVLSIGDSSPGATITYNPAYPATTGWDFATGIGTVNAYNLVMNWPLP